MLTELQRQTLTIYCSTLNNLHLTRVQYLAPSNGMNTDCRNGRNFGGCWGTNQILFHDLWSQLNTEWSNLVESNLVMKLGPQSPFFSGFPGRRSVLTAGIRTGCSHYTSTHVQTLSVLSLHHIFTQESEEKWRNARGRLRFCADWKMASCAYRQCKSI